jgi:hypothetical protein
MNSGPFLPAYNKDQKIKTWLEQDRIFVAVLERRH